MEKDRRSSAGFEIRRLNHKMMTATMHHTGCPPKGKFITPAQAFVLEYLYGHSDEDVYQKDIEKTLDVSRATVANMLKTMEKNGLINRLKVEGDARLKKIVLTQEAYERQAHILERMRYVDAKATEGISDEELDAFYATLRKISHNMEQLRPPNRADVPTQEDHLQEDDPKENREKQANSKGE
jgi:DNA-binding MarR family transcriptional regulator